MTILTSKYLKNALHVIFWSTFIFFHVSYFSVIQGFYVAVNRSIILLFLYLFVFYSNWFILFPRYYFKKKYSTFIFISFFILLTASIIKGLIEKHFNILGNFSAYHIIPDKTLRPYFISFIQYSFVLFISSLLKISDYYGVQRRQKELLQQQKTEAELKLLKAQLNPHFLFNALNNIYALVLTHSENAAHSLMSLSLLLRYIIYEAVAEKVSLEKEIINLNYYIDLESLRLNYKENLQTSISVDSGKHLIMPLIFIPFVENCFKHSNVNQDGYILIKIYIQNEILHFYCENSYAKSAKNVDKLGGIGLQNIKKRLRISYPDKHILNITNENNIFKVTLTIEL